MSDVVRRIDRARVGKSAQFAGLFGASLLIGAGCSKEETASKPKTPQAVSVSVQPVKRAPVQRTVEVLGTLFGEEDATISNKVPGKVVEIHKDIGDRAGPGEPLVQLLRNDYQLQVNQKQSALSELLARLGLSAVPPANFDTSSLPSVQRARLQRENAKSKYERGRQLHEQKPPLLSDQDFADLRTAYDVAASAYDVEILAANGLVGEAGTRKAELDIANRALLDTTIRAPIPTLVGVAPTAGETTQSASDSPATQPTTAPSEDSKPYVVAARMVSVGELATSFTPMFRLVDDDPLKLHANVPERFVSQVQIGQEAEVHVESYGDAFKGAVSRVNPQIDPASRTFPIEVTIPNGDHRLRPGSFARAAIKTRVDPNTIVLPRESIVSFAGVNKVFVVKDGKAVEVPLELGATVGRNVEVKRGLKGDEKIVTSGAGKLASGVPVTISQQSSAGGEGASTRPAIREASAAGQ